MTSWRHSKTTSESFAKEPGVFICLFFPLLREVGEREMEGNQEVSCETMNTDCPQWGFAQSGGINCQCKSSFWASPGLGVQWVLNPCPLHFNMFVWMLEQFSALKTAVWFSENFVSRWQGIFIISIILSVVLWLVMLVIFVWRLFSAHMTGARSLAVFHCHPLPTQHHPHLLSITPTYTTLVLHYFTPHLL